MNEQRPFEEYLGDGLYADYDGYQIVLAANDRASGNPTDKVYLEPSREACQRLSDAGIVLKTEVVWYKFPDIDWKLGRIGEEIDKYVKHIPAPSMAEVLMELPRGTVIQKMGKDFRAWREWTELKPDWVDFDYEDVGYRKSPPFRNTNPTDALIYLMIWARKEKKDES